MLLVATINLILTPQGIVTPQTGTWTIISFISQKCFAENSKNIIGGPMIFTLQGWNATGYIAGTVRSSGQVSIPPTATKVMVENGSLVMRINDMGSVPMVGTLIDGTQGSFNETWKITDPGQIKVLAV